MQTQRRSDFGLGRVGIWSFDLDMQPMARAQETAIELEELGYRCVWVPEAVGREPFASCAMLLSATKHLTMATGIASMHARSAMTMAAGWKTLAERFGDRFLLGIGASHQHLAEKVHQSKYVKPFSAMVEYLDAMDSALFFAAPPVTAPRRVLAALGPKMLKLSAQRGLGAHPYFVPVEHTVGAREILGADALLAPEIAVVFDTNAETARATARKHMLTYNRLPNYANNLLRLGYSQSDIAGPDKLPSDKMVDAIVAWGTLETVVERINAHIDAGANHVSVQVLSNKDGELPIAQWRELATALKSFN
ncbi:MAG: LLM class F420-dependent oxidoreductase [Actinomycetota bacterium]|nr:LLM class F420-dependent oxidoreductase [Actinomycetota bacterium]MDA3003806.1 LLM class F420-dependent oxidoreductase [Actinomycetota bacterium]